MITLYLIRHLPTYSNLSGIFMGRNDCDISDSIDYNRIIALRNDLHDIDNSFVFSSPLQRCKKTAHIVFPHSKVIIDDRLIEKDLGEWAGKNKKAVKEEFPDFFDKSGHLNITLSPPNGEDYTSFIKRIRSFIDDMIKYYNDKEIIVFTHGGVIAAILKNFSTTDLFDGDCVNTKSIKHLKVYSVTIRE